jgi:DNA-binding CsgD family transcriptional regulator
MERATGARSGLLGRDRECAILDDLIAAVATGRSGALVLHGEAGIGKTALLDYAGAQDAGCRVARLAGIEAEADLAFGALHQLCAPFQDKFARLPQPQRSALQTAFGLSTGPPPDRLLVGLAVLSLLADVADDRPLLCLVDDAQWLDQVSAQTMAFVARRLLAERVGLIFAVREPVPDHPMQDLPRLDLTGLDYPDARALMASVAPTQMDNRIRDRILAEARGNPLALIEFPRHLRALQAGGDVGPSDQPPADQVELGFLSRIRALSPQAQRLLLLAAAEPIGDMALLRRAAARLAIDLEPAAAEAHASELVTARTMVRFRHPLVRSAAYRYASAAERHQTHRALAEVTDPLQDPDRRAWHLARAATMPDEDVAVSLEQAARRAQARGGLAASAAFLDRAAQLTPDPARRASRTLAAAQAKSRAGQFSEATALLDAIGLQPLEPHEDAHAKLVRGQILFSSRSASAGLALLLEAAEQLETADPALAAQTYRDALYAALTAGRLPGDTGLEQVASAILAMRQPTDRSRSDLLLDGAARVVAEGYAAGVPALRQALAAYRAGPIPSDEGLGWLPLACRVAHTVWDFETWSALSQSLLDLTADAGALAILPTALLLRLSNRIYAGDLATADALAAQAATLGEATGSNFFARYCALVVAPWRGEEARVRQAIDAITEDLALRGEGKVLTATEWAAAVLYNGLGRHEEAFAAATKGSAYPQEMGLASWSVVELAEAATRLGRHDDAARAARYIGEMAAASPTDWALGTAAYVSALVADGPAAERRYREAIERLERVDVRLIAARVQLLYGEWLRREGRSADARRRLESAHELLVQIGATGFAERARRELAAAGVAVAGPTPARKSTLASLTDQEDQIARLAADGLTNPQIGSMLFLSAHTVEWHLRKVYGKLGIHSRREIAAKLADPAAGGR